MLRIDTLRPPSPKAKKKKKNKGLVKLALLWFILLHAKDISNNLNVAYFLLQYKCDISFTALVLDLVLVVLRLLPLIHQIDLGETFLSMMIGIYMSIEWIGALHLQVIEWIDALHLQVIEWIDALHLQV